MPAIIVTVTKERKLEIEGERASSDRVIATGSAGRPCNEREPSRIVTYLLAYWSWNLITFPKSKFESDAKFTENCRLRRRRMRRRGGEIARDGAREGKKAQGRRRQERSRPGDEQNRTGGGIGSHEGRRGPISRASLFRRGAERGAISVLVL